MRHMLHYCRRLKEKLEGFQDIARQVGKVNAVLYAMDRGFSAISGGRVRIFKYHFVAQPVLATPFLPPGRGRKLEVRQVPPGDPLAVSFPRPAAVIAERYRQGARCLAACKDGELVGYHWHVHRRYEEDEVRATFGLKNAAAVWDFDVQVAPAHRLGVAFLRLWDEANALLSGQGVRWSCSRISAYNPESMKSHGRLNAAILGTAVFIRIGPWQAMCSDVQPHWHLSFSGHSRPVFDFDTTWLDSHETGPTPSPWRNHAAS
jgi:hypothetical protein